MVDIDKRTTRGRQLAARLNRETAIKATRFFVIKDGDRYRVWQSGTPRDVFSMYYQHHNIQELVQFWKHYPSMFIFADPEEYED